MEEQGMRPETSKCSRMEKRRLVSQSHQRQESSQAQRINGITLQQYFQGSNFRVLEINEDECDNLQVAQPRAPPLQNNNFRIKTDKKINNNKLLERSPAQNLTMSKDFNQRKINRPHITSNEFFQNEDELRKTKIKLKYGRMKEDVINRFGNPDQDLINKYAEKFNINREPPKLTLAPRELLTKIK
ncbi:unnamed protein product [Paramecium primaurelia]|uniref:Uncharacterized protein n=1 Tax=Paramecium primaurelia TaxID=5886 RepID=A0A8S1N5M2_PARPR|nr:unnamed protein product [Paramecium primaurelia]